jgi:beta-glucosidase
LITTILRGEWGYTGIVMTDWWAKMNNIEAGGEGRGNKLRDMVRAGNDLYMVVNNYGAVFNASDDDLEESLANGSLTLGELQERAKYILTFLMDTKAMERERKFAMAIIDIPPLTVKTGSAPPAPGLDIAVKMGETTYFEIETPNTYWLLMRFKSNNKNTDQICGELYINDKNIATVANRGTHGREVTKVIIKVTLAPGQYSLRVDETRPHLEVSQVKFVVS